MLEIILLKLVYRVENQAYSLFPLGSYDLVMDTEGFMGRLVTHFNVL